MSNISAIKLPDSTIYNIKAGAIPYGEVDSTSTSTAFTATVPGINELKNGTIMLLRNGVVTSASGFKININGLGAKPVYNNLATGNPHTPTNPTRDTTIFNINYTMLFIYDEDLVSGGAWICYRGYDANTNTIGYQLRGNNGTRPAADKGYKYRLWLSSLDNQSWVPINTSTATDASTSRSLNSRVIDPFGEIVYYAYNGTTNAAANLTATNIWQQYTLTIGYSYVKSLTAWDPVYLKCEPQTGGGAVMKDIVQALPSTADGFIYIYLGIAYSATAMELRFYHPVYYHDGTGIRAWIGIKVPTKTSELTNDSGYTSFSGSYNDLTDKPTIPVLPSNIVNTITTKAGTHTEITSATGTVNFNVPTKTSHLTNDSNFVSDANYVHTDNNFTDAYQTKLAGIAAGAEVNVQSDWNATSGDAFIKNKPTIPSPGTGTDYPVMDGTRALGTQAGYARVDHVHPSDTSRVPITTTVNGKALSSNITIDATEITGYTDSETQQSVSVYNWIRDVQQEVDDKVQDVKLDGTSIVNINRVANISSQDILAGLQIQAQDVGFQAPVQTSYLENASDVEEALLALDTATANKLDPFKVTLSYSNNTYTVDKTVAQIDAAILANKYVYLYDTTETVGNAEIIIGTLTQASPQGASAIEFWAESAGSSYGEPLYIHYVIEEDTGDVNVYTVSRGTVTSVAVSNATNGGLSVSGSPITSSGTITVGHSNILTNAQTTQAVYPIAIDKNGHISSYGSAVTSMTPTSHTHGNIANGGTISSTAVTPASTDYILISDTSNSGKIERGIAIGTDTTKYLRNDGTWQTVSTEDTKVTNTLATTTKYYVTGTTSSSTNTGTQSFDSGIYATTTAGQLNATTYKVNEQVTLQWNSTDSSLDFVFA